MGIRAHSPCGASSSTPHRRRQGFEELTGSCRCAAHRLGPRRCARGLQAALLKGFREHAPLTPTLTPQGRGSGRRLCFLPCGTGEVYRGDALRCAASALSPLRPGALRSAWKYPLCSGGGCQVTTHLNRSGLSHRNAASSKGHFLWVTFLLGQQKKSDSAAGRPSKRLLRKRPVRRHAPDKGKATTDKRSKRPLRKRPLAEEPRSSDTAKTGDQSAR